MQLRNVRILGTGKYLPSRQVTSEEMDAKLRLEKGWTAQITDVQIRHFVQEETASFMGAKAAEQALEHAKLTFEQIDCIVCTSGTMEQPIPSTASLIQKAMGKSDSGVPAFDINSTCLSFITGLDVMSYLVHAGRYNRVLFVATEIASKGLNWEQKESTALFGDGAAAVIIGPSESTNSQILCAKMNTYSKGSTYSEIRGGGTRLPALEYTNETREHFTFHMDGKKIYKIAIQYLPHFVDELLASCELKMDDMKLVIPHQGSAMAMRLVCKKLNISTEQLMYTTPNHGNTIAASVPIGLHEAIHQNRVNRGDTLMLLGTSAGMSLGGIVLVY